ncbi:MAG: hypothetical protein EOO88_59035 [Pedobacter sp.]|nr:MAG: hypothetical protein EOO88_59035 [Pedobacter sp.]
MSFETNIFINCPFDKEYKPILKSIVFTTLILGFTPQISTTKSSSDQRISEIIRLIQESKYSIHDISRSESKEAGELSRFNMPYEMGLDVGCCVFGKSLMRTKRCLILEDTKNRYDVVISDISGQDIKVHNNKPRKSMEAVLEWFTTNGALPVPNVPSASSTWARYQEFNAKAEVALAAANHTRREIREISIERYIAVLKQAIS